MGRIVIKSTDFLKEYDGFERIILPKDEEYITIEEE